MYLHSPIGILYIGVVVVVAVAVAVSGHPQLLPQQPQVEEQGPQSELHQEPRAKGLRHQVPLEQQVQEQEQQVEEPQQQNTRQHESRQNRIRLATQRQRPRQQQQQQQQQVEERLVDPQEQQQPLEEPVEEPQQQQQQQQQVVEPVEEPQQQNARQQESRPDEPKKNRIRIAIQRPQQHDQQIRGIRPNRPLPPRLHISPQQQGDALSDQPEGTSSSSGHRLGSKDQSGGIQFECPEYSGIFGDPDQCDKYYECVNFVPFEKLCDDGLVFDKVKGYAGHADPCDTPYIIDCTGRPLLQNSTSTSIYCPRDNGLFAHPDTTICDVFYTCIKGRPTATSCVSSLQFEPNSGTCTWPSAANRQGCQISKSATINGFTCPGGTVINSIGVRVAHPTYANADDCSKFYVCLNGVKPQQASCDKGLVYNDETGLCDLVENVPSCAGPPLDYYDDYYYDDVTEQAPK